jgi:hypothetical protein
MASHRMHVRARVAVVASLAVHAVGLFVVLRMTAHAVDAREADRRAAATAMPTIEIAVPPVASEPIEVEVLDVPAPDAPAPDAPARGIERAIASPAAPIAHRAAVTSGAVAPAAEAAAPGMPSRARWLAMRGPDLALGDRAVDELARSGRPPERVAKSGRVEPSGGGNAVIRDLVTTVTVERDGTVQLHDRPDIELNWDLHLPSPDQIKRQLKQSGREMAKWYADPYAKARVGPAQDVPRQFAATPGACDRWDDPCSRELRERDRRVDSLERQRRGSVAHGKLDLTSMLMRAVGVGDAYASRKRKLLDDTRAERAELGAQHHAEDLARAGERMQRNLELLWRTISDPAERRDALFALWDECAEADGPIGEAGQRARLLVIGWIRAKLPSGSPGAFTPEEIARRAAQQHSSQPFAPYE